MVSPGELKRIRVAFIGLVLVPVTLAFTAAQRTQDRPRDPSRFRPPLLVRPKPLTDSFPDFDRFSNVDKAPRLPLLSPARILVEPPRFSYGDVYSGVDFTQSGAMMVRVFANRNWELQVWSPRFFWVRQGPRRRVSITRMSWRTEQSGVFSSLTPGRAVTIARGRPTGFRGQSILVDLKLRLEEPDPLGLYRTRLRVGLRNLFR